MTETAPAIISPIEYLRVVFRRKWFIIIPTFAGLVLGICAGLVLPKKYQSNTVILVQEGKTDNPLFDKIAVSTSVGERLATIRESMLGWNSLVTLVKRLNLDTNIKTPFEFEQLILGIRRKTAIRLRGPSIIELVYEGDNPEKTQAVVRNITEILIERNVQIQNQETADAIKFIEEQLRVYRGKIMSAEIAGYQDQLNSLLVDSTEEHPLVKKLREQVNAKKAELEKENLEYTENIRLDKESTGSIVEDIRKALDGLQTTIHSSAASDAAAGQGQASPDSQLYQIMLIDKLDKVVARDVHVNEGIYNNLLQRLETAKITQRLQSSKEGTRYTIIDPPRLPLKPVKPNKPLVATMGLFLGAVVGAALVFLREFLDKSFIDVQEAKEYLGQPLLGAISRIATFDAVMEEKHKEKWMLIIMAIAGVIAVIVSAFIATFARH